MTIGSKLAKLRREAGYTQEQLAEILGVSRQAISKWESDLAYPETEKLIKLGELYKCSMDYLLKDDVEDVKGTPLTAAKAAPRLTDFHFEYKSKRTMAGLPLCHINFGLGKSAKGILAIGLAARGVVSLGIFSMGLLSFGVFSLGLLALGAFTLGILSAGAIAVGIFAFGAVCLGIISAGAVAVGCFSAGGVAVGRYLAVGDHAYGDIALGITKINANRYGVAPFNGAHTDIAAQYLDKTVPAWLGWAKSIVKWFL